MAIYKGMGAGGGFSAGWGRPGGPRGKPVAIPGDPDGPLERSDIPTVSGLDGRLRDPRTAENIAAHCAALSPRRFSWEV